MAYQGKHIGLPLCYPCFMNINIIHAEEKDASLVALLARITFTAAFGYLFTQTELQDYLNTTFSVAKIRSSILKENNRFYLALADELPVGYAKVKWHSPYENLTDASPAQLQKIYILQSFIGNGIGEQLQQQIFKDVNTRGKQMLWLAVWEQNHKARAFYERAGYYRETTYGYGIGEKYFTYDVMVKRFTT